MHTYAIPSLSWPNIIALPQPHPQAGWNTVQALRQSLLKKYSVVRSDLDSLHNSRMSAYEKAECLESIRAQVQAAWRTDEIRRSKPSPQVNFHLVSYRRIYIHF